MSPALADNDEPVGPRDVARYAVFFAAEAETFDAFRQWAIHRAATDRGRDWAECLTLAGLREVAMELHRMDVHPS